MYTDIIQDFLGRHNYINVIPRAALIDMDGTLYDSRFSDMKAAQALQP